MNPRVMTVVAVVGVALLAAWSLWPAPSSPLPEERDPTVQATGAPEGRGADGLIRAPGGSGKASSEEPLRGANGMPVEGERRVKEEGLVRSRPIGSPPPVEDWAAVRSEAHEEWVQSAWAGLQMYVDREQPSEEAEAAIRDAYEILHDRIRETRESMEAGNMHPLEAREELQQAREDAFGTIANALGEDEARMMQLEMIKRVEGGAF